MKPQPPNGSKRRNFLKSVLSGAIAAPAILVSPSAKAENYPQIKNNRLKVSLNAFSFNVPLRDGKMTLDDLLVFCAEKSFLAVDITAYYFPGYPKVPADDYLYHIKRKAFSLGLEISGTGVRNDFTEPDPVKRKESAELVKNWIIAAEKIGAPVIRIFAGTQNPTAPREKVMEWMYQDIRECVAFGKSHGVVVALQNHNDYIKTADEITQILKEIDSEWFGLILDTGSYRIGNPYEEIRKTTPYAVNWQIKEKIFIDGKEVDVDLDKLFGIIKASGYQGYIPLETLGEGDPKVKVSAFLEKINQSLSRV